ncbi:hypothetical protein SAR116_1783 [Candidatus Puniceispirillum marinum IMCC1322]|uniref:Uncharacterized protein n=1 Tax=Puniceispirillum marinum (strain IMCC1322) TaxID=488538 RepID=D5BMI2_PUNMI|nr:hypothetical protein SAR116_1783 [Candidatus Puniceispirillum marinum IMCC1322]
MLIGNFCTQTFQDAGAVIFLRHDLFSHYFDDCLAMAFWNNETAAFANAGSFM